jgi:hypothetical protein
VQYEPTGAVGSMDTATLTVSDANSDTPASAMLSGTVGATVLAISPSGTFSGSGMMMGSSTVTFTVKNTGAIKSGTLMTPTYALANTSGTAPDLSDFSITNACTSALAPSGQCTYAFTFTPPDDAGLPTGMFDFTTSITDSNGVTSNIAVVPANTYP